MGDARVLDDRYELREVIGAGGMAEVWRAHDRRLNRDVAVKILSGPAGRDASKRKRIEREARALAASSHPNIVAVYDYGEEDRDGEVAPFVVMELVDGPDLHRYLAKRGPLEVGHALSVLCGVLGAVERAHASGVVHGDLKPANVFIDAHGPKVGDFGVARVLAQETGSTTLAATPSFAAPEVLKGERPTPASDVYSVACLAFQLLAGRAPYTGATAWEVASKHVEEAVPSVRSFRSDVPSDVDRAIQRGMEKNPKRRYASAAAFAAALGAREDLPPIATIPVDDHPARGEPTRTEVLDGPRPDAVRLALLGPLAHRRLPRGRALLALLAALLLAVAFLAMRDPGPSRAAVPDVVGERVTAAATRLDDAGFAVDVSYRLVTTGEPNRVLETIPAGDEDAVVGSRVHVIASAFAATPTPVVTAPPEDDDDARGKGKGRRKGNKDDD